MKKWKTLEAELEAALHGVGPGGPGDAHSRAVQMEAGLAQSGYERNYVHDDPQPHSECAEPARCPCECRECKRAYFDAGRPGPPESPDTPDRGTLINEHAATGMRLTELHVELAEIEKQRERANVVPYKARLASLQEEMATVKRRFVTQYEQLGRLGHFGEGLRETLKKRDDAARSAATYPLLEPLPDVLNCDGAQTPGPAIRTRVETEDAQPREEAQTPRENEARLRSVHWNGAITMAATIVQDVMLARGLRFTNEEIQKRLHAERVDPYTQEDAPSTADRNVVYNYDGELFGGKVDCKHEIVSKWSGVECRKCHAWFCY